MDRLRHEYTWGYFPRTQPRRVQGGIKTKSERGVIGATWWSQRWVAVLESLGMGTRLARGRSYARRGQVLSIDITAGVVKAKVQGSLDTPYSITIQLQPLSYSDWDRVTEVMVSQAIFAAKLLAGEMPTSIEDAFGAVNLSLFPTTERDLRTKCSCPDWANPCKHIAAVYYLLAERFDEDPFLIFKLRGCTREEIIAALRQKRIDTLPSEGITPAASEQEDEKLHTVDSLSLDDSPASFWQAGESVTTFPVNLEKPQVDNALLKRLGEAPYIIGGQNLTTLLAKAYDVVAVTAQRKVIEG